MVATQLRKYTKTHQIPYFKEVECYVYVNDTSVRRRKGEAGRRKEKKAGRKEIVLFMMIVLLEGCW